MTDSIVDKAAADSGQFAALRPASATYFIAVLLLCGVAGFGAYSAHTTDMAGHVITGMNNHIVWGLPHVFAVSLIVTASGALNGATLSSVFQLQQHKPFARMSVALAITFLLGGLAILVLDLGRPDRLIVAMTHYNFRSIFTWNVFLYLGFIGVGIIYLWVMMERRFNRHIALVGKVALVWRIVLTSGTGSIFGFLVGRNALDSAIMAPIFIALSLTMGTAAVILVFLVLNRWRSGMRIEAAISSLTKLLTWFIVSLAYFVAVKHLTNLYIAQHSVTEANVLTGPLSGPFWLGYVFIGTLLPLTFLSSKRAKGLITRFWLVITCSSVIVGGMTLIYVVIIGSQNTPQVLFPGKLVIASTFGDAGIPTYVPSFWEWGVGFGGIATALLLCLCLFRILPLLPDPQVGINPGSRLEPQEP